VEEADLPSAGARRAAIYTAPETVAGLADDLDVGELAEHLGQARARQGFVVDHEHLHGRGSGRVSSHA
jgi:hypothetical protein